MFIILCKLPAKINIFKSRLDRRWTWDGVVLVGNDPALGREMDEMAHEGPSGPAFLWSYDLFPQQVQNIIVRNQEFGLSVDEPTDPFYYSNYDGVLGMAYPGVAIPGFKTLMQNMVQQDQLSEPIFSFYFSR